MVNQYNPEPEDEEIDESLEEELDESTESDQPEDTDEQGEPDPLDVIRASIEKLSPLSELNPAQLKSALGRVSSLQSAIDRMQAKDPAADIAPKLAAMESYIEELADAILGSDFTPDESKQRIQTVRSARKAEIDRASLLADLRKEQQGNAPQIDPAEVKWLDASNEVVEIANEKGFDASTIPVEVWMAGKALGSVVKAVKYVEAWIDAQQETDEKPAARVATRKVAAGKGSPQRAGGAGLSDDQLWDDYGMNPQKYKTPEAVAKVREAGRRLGYTT